MSDIIDVLTRPSFMETAAVLLLTALLTGLLVPYIKGRLDTKNLEKQQRTQDSIARRNAIVQAQSELLEVVADTLGGLRMLYMKIAFYAKDGRAREYKEAFADFESRSWEFLAGYRTQLSKARALTTEKLLNELRALYYDTLMPTDRRLYALINKRWTARQRSSRADRAAWKAFWDYLFGDFTDEIDSLLGDLADEIRRTDK